MTVAPFVQQPPPPPWLPDLERRIAVAAARADIETLCAVAESHCRRGGRWANWHDTADIATSDGAEFEGADLAAVADAVRYLDALGQLDHHHLHPSWVRFRENAR